MDIDAQKEAIKNYYKTHTQKQILETFYKDDLKVFGEFDRSLVEKVIDNQMELDDEHLYYCHEEEGLTEFLPIFRTFRDSLGLPWIECGDTDFPTFFVVLEHDGKQMVLSLMIGQGSSMDFCTVDGFKSWMKRIRCTYKWPEKAITVDELEKMVADRLAEINNKIASAKDTLDKE